jgi:class 3 adenylate cyclase
MKPFHIGAWATSPPVDALYQNLWASKGIRNIEIEPVDTIEKLLDEREVSGQLDSPATTRGDFDTNLRDDLDSPSLIDRPAIALPQGFNPQGTITILFSDIEDSTSITERLGDIRGQEILRVHNDIVRQQVVACDGFEVKAMGDGFMVAFSSARRALQCAIAIQRAMAANNEESVDEQIRVRMGLHTGEVINEAGDFFGRNVILAARIADQAQGSQILVSSLLKELTESSREFTFSEERNVELKGLTGEYRLVEVSWQI